MRTLGLLEANLDAGLIDIVQVDSFRQNIETQRAQLLNLQVTYQTSARYVQGRRFCRYRPTWPIEADDSDAGAIRIPRSAARSSCKHMIDDFVKAVGELPAEPAKADLSGRHRVCWRRCEQRLAGQFDSRPTTT